MTDNLFNILALIVEWIAKNIQSVTLLLVAWTAFEGFRSSREAHRSNELKLLPFLMVHFKQDFTKNTDYFIDNQGEGVAYDIEIEDWLLILTDLQRVWKLEMKIEGANSLNPKGERRPVVTEASEIPPGREIDKEMLLHALGYNHGKLIITFKNAAGHKFYTRVMIGLDQTRVLIPAKRLNLFEFLRLKSLQAHSYMLQRWWKFLWNFSEPRIDWGSKRSKK